MKCLLLFTLLMTRVASAQDSLRINGHAFVVSTQVVENEWETKDTLNTLSRIENMHPVDILTFYAFKDNGSDCNNAFWSTKTMEIRADSVFFTTHYFQQTGLDPIPEWRKQIYRIDHSGKLHKIFDQYKYYNRNEWVFE